MRKILFSLITILILLSLQCGEPKSSKSSVKEEITTIDYPKIIPIKAGDKFGFVDEGDNLVGPDKYLNVLPFYKDRAIVIGANGSVGLIDSGGKVILPVLRGNSIQWKGNLINRLNNYPENYLFYSTTKLKGYVVMDLDGNQLLPDVYRRIYIGAPDQFVVVDHSNKSAVIDKQGQIIIPFQNDDIGYHQPRKYPKREGFYRIYEFASGEDVFYDATGKEIDRHKSMEGQPVVPGLAYKLSPPLDNIKAEVVESLIGGYRLHHLSERELAGDYLVDETGKIIAENCKTILPCEEIIIKYMSQSASPRQRELNLSNREGQLLFPRNYDSIIPIDGNDDHCPTRYIAHDRKLARAYLLDSEGKPLLEGFKQLIRLSPNFLKAQDTLSNYFVLNADGQVVFPLKDFSTQLPDWRKRKVVAKNGVIGLESKRTIVKTKETVYLNQKGELSMQLAEDRDPNLFFLGDLVFIDGSEWIDEIDFLGPDHVIIERFDRFTYEETVIKASFDEIALAVIKKGRDQVQIIKNGITDSLVIDLAIGDYFWRSDDKEKRPCVVSRIMGDELEYVGGIIHSFVARDGRFHTRYSGNIKIPNLPRIVERVEKKSYAEHKAKWPHKKSVSWENKEGILMEGQVYTAPVNTDSLIIFQRPKKGRKKFFSVHPDTIIE